MNTKRYSSEMVKTNILIVRIEGKPYIQTVVVSATNNQFDINYRYAIEAKETLMLHHVAGIIQLNQRLNYRA